MEADDELVPDEAAQSERDAPGPLLEGQRRREAEPPSVLNEDHLEQIIKIKITKFSQTRKHLTGKEAQFMIVPTFYHLYPSIFMAKNLIDLL